MKEWLAQWPSGISPFRAFTKARTMGANPNQKEFFRGNFAPQTLDLALHLKRRMKLVGQVNHLVGICRHISGTSVSMWSSTMIN
jgi:hypothetical protein